MKRQSTLLLGLLAGLAAGNAGAQEKETGSLKFKALKNFDYVMPSETWTTVSGSVAIKHPNGAGFLARRDGLKLLVDTTADGRCNEDVKGVKGYLRFRSKSEDQSFMYAARFKGSGKEFSYATSCAMTGTVAGVPLTVLDANNNGIYNEVGKDALVVGTGKAAAYLSKVISHKGELFTLEISEDGSEASVAPHACESGEVDLASGFRGAGRLEAAIIQDQAGNSFNTALTGGLRVPAGEYRIVSGFISKGSNSARIASGKMAPIVVRPGSTAKLEWGGDLLAEFDYTVADGEVSVAPTAVHYYGRAGEEYVDWLPNAKSPKFIVRDQKTGKEVGSFLFAGC